MQNSTMNNTFALLDEEIATAFFESKEKAKASKSAKPTKAQSNVISIKMPTSGAFDQLEAMTTHVIHKLKFGQMLVPLWEYYTCWTKWICEARAGTNLKQRQAFINNCYQHVSKLLIDMDSTFTGGEIASIFSSPLVITKEIKGVPTEEYMVHDKDFVKVFRAIYNKLVATKTFIDRSKNPSNDDITLAKKLSGFLASHNNMEKQLWNCLNAMEASTEKSRKDYGAKQAALARAKKEEKQQQEKDALEGYVVLRKKKPTKGKSK